MTTFKRPDLLADAKKALRDLSQELINRGHHVSCDITAMGNLGESSKLSGHEFFINRTYIRIRFSHQPWGEGSTRIEQLRVMVVRTYPTPNKSWPQRKDGSFNIAKIADIVLEEVETIKAKDQLVANNLANKAAVERLLSRYRGTDPAPGGYIRNVTLGSTLEPDSLTAFYKFNGNEAKVRSVLELLKGAGLLS